MNIPAFRNDVNALNNIAENSMNNTIEALNTGIEIGIITTKHGIDYSINKLLPLEIMIINPNIFKNQNPFSPKNVEAAEINESPCE